MADKTAIEWTDATWNPITGCKVLSAGCKHCYAMKLAGGRLKHHPTREGLTIDTKAGPVWNGEVRLNWSMLGDPGKWKRPRRIFVCAHADLFYEAVSDEWIDLVFAVMAANPQHTFQVLTKRADRMRAYLSAPERLRRIYNQWSSVSSKPAEAQAWPLPNVWLGVSAEDQHTADDRIPDLLATPAAKRWISAEPLLGPLDLLHVRAVEVDGKYGESMSFYDALVGRYVSRSRGYHSSSSAIKALDWVVLGGESGAGARPMNPQWARSVRDQCVIAGVPFLFKQWGEYVSVSEVEGDGEHFTFKDGRTVRKVGKKLAGRTLDGQLHDGYPA